jgi:hypothetical protein
MGHRLIAILAFLNALGLFGCVILTAAAISRDPAAAITVAQALQLSVRMFVVGCALPAVAWAISAMELNRANDRVRILESWATYLLLLVSLGLFFIGSWRVPDSLLAGVS